MKRGEGGGGKGGGGRGRKGEGYPFHGGNLKAHLSIYNKMFWSIHIAELNGISHTGHSEAKTLGQGCLGDLFPWELLDLTLQFILQGEGQLSE